MAVSRTTRRIIGGVLALLVAAGVSGGVAWRIQKKNAEAQAAKDVPVALEFAPADLAAVEAHAARAAPAGVGDAAAAAAGRRQGQGVR